MSMENSEHLSRGERTRLAILDISERLFLKNGYNGTSMRQIARGAHVALGGIYNHFGSKEDIFRILLSERMPYPEFSDALMTIESTNGRQMLEEAFDRLVALMKLHEDYFALLLTDVREFNGRIIREQSVQILPAMVQFVQRVLAAGGLRKDLHGFILVRELLSLVIGYIITETIVTASSQPRLPQMPTDEEVLAGLKDMMLRGLIRPEEKLEA